MATQLFETIVSLQRQKIEQMQAQSKSKTTFFLSKEIIVLPTVFSPGSDTELRLQKHILLFEQFLSILHKQKNMFLQPILIHRL